jgi:hypothetical protein
MFMTKNGQNPCSRAFQLDWFVAKGHCQWQERDSALPDFVCAQWREGTAISGYAI